MKAKLLVNSLRMGLILAIALSAVPRQRAFALGTRRYARQGGAFSGSCTSWATACELAWVLGPVAQPGDEVWVRAGVYTPAGTQSASLPLNDGVKVYGGFTGVETQLSQRNWQTNVTTLSGDIGTPGVAFDNVYHVVLTSGTTSAAVLDGFTISGGYASNLGLTTGGGILNTNGSPTLRNLVIRDNFSVNDGGGMYSSGGSPSLTNVTFTNNSTDINGAGGGLMLRTGNPSLTNVTFISNRARFGGGLLNGSGSASTLTNVTFISNSATFGGGGMDSEFGTTALLRVRFIGNTATTYGGGMLSEGGGNAVLRAVSFNGNSAQSGAGMYNDGPAQFNQVTFTNNIATWAALFNSNSHVTLSRVTFTGNQGQVAGAIYNQSNSVVTVANSTFNGNAALATDGGGDGGAIVNEGSTLTLNGVTLAGNHAVSYGGALYAWGASTVKLVNTTFNANQAGTSGGAIFVLAGTLSLKHVTISGNTAPTGAALGNSGGTAAVDRSILWADGSGEIAGGGATTLTNSILKGPCPLGVTCGVNVLHQDPKLGLLANNGGFTKTMALLTGSAAIDKVTCLASVTKDQRGIHRPQGLRCDMGAYEYVP